MSYRRPSKIPLPDKQTIGSTSKPLRSFLLCAPFISVFICARKYFSAFLASFCQWKILSLMPIRGFDHYLFAKSIHKLPISVLNDTAIAIDGFWFLKKYLSLQGYTALIDYRPFLEAALEPLAQLAEKTQVLWVWDGMDYERSNYTKDDYFARLSETICNLNSNPHIRNLIDQEYFVESATAFLRAHGVHVVRAPYSAIAQCVYFLRERCVRYIFTKMDAVLFPGGTKVVTDLSFDRGCIETIDRNELFAINNFNLPGLQAFAFLSGCEICPTVPCYATDFSIFNIFELLKNNSLEAQLEKYFRANNPSDAEYEGSNEAEYVRMYHRAFIVVEYHPIMALNGQMECLNNTDVPADLEKIFGKTLDRLLYQELFNCNLSPRLLNRLAREQLLGTEQGNEILAAFKTLLERRGTTDPIYASDAIAKLLGVSVVWNDRMNRAGQLLFVKLQGRCTDVACLIDLLNATTFSRPDGSVQAGKSAGKSGQDRSPSLNPAGLGAAPASSPLLKEISAEKFYFYIKAKEYILMFKDLVSLLNAFQSTKNDLIFDPSFGDLLHEWQRNQLRGFVKNNISNSERFTDFMEILNK